MLAYKPLIIRSSYRSKSTAASSEILDSALEHKLEPNEIRKLYFSPSFDLKAMQKILDHDNHEMREKFR